MIDSFGHFPHFWYFMFFLFLGEHIQSWTQNTPVNEGIDLSLVTIAPYIHKSYLLHHIPIYILINQHLQGRKVSSVSIILPLYTFYCRNVSWLFLPTLQQKIAASIIIDFRFSDNSMRITVQVKPQFDGTWCVSGWFSDMKMLYNISIIFVPG